MIKKVFLKSYGFINNLFLSAFALIFILIPSFLAIIISTTFSILFGTKSRAWKLLVSLDQTLNTVFGGDEDETFSSRCHREGKTKPKYKQLEEFIDLLFWILRGEIGHCMNAYHHELKRRKRSWRVKLNSFVGLTYYGEDGYLCLVNNILNNGVSVPDRTGVGSVAIFDAKLVFNSFPLFTHRKISPRLAFEEMWFFLNGETDTSLLEEKGVNFWKGNTSREFLDNRGLEFLPEKSMGAAYSLQWRDFGGWYDSDNGVDQLERLINSIKKDRYGRRHLVTLWNPSEEHLMPLTPCWWACQFVVLPNNGVDTLHLKLINRSLDVLYGAPFALQQYRMLQMAIANMFDLEVGALVADLSQVHIYNNQIEWAKELLMRDWWLDGDNSITLDKKVKGIYGKDGLINLKFSDFSVKYEDYNAKPFKTPKPKMAV